MRKEDQSAGRELHFAVGQFLELLHQQHALLAVEHLDRLREFPIGRSKVLDELIVIAIARLLIDGRRFAAARVRARDGRRLNQRDSNHAVEPIQRNDDRQSDRTTLELRQNHPWVR